MKSQASSEGSAPRITRTAILVSVACAAVGLAAPAAFAQGKPIRIGVPTAMQLQVGRDTQDAVKMAIDDLNAKGGLLGRKLEMVVADETENPETQSIDHRYQLLRHSGTRAPHVILRYSEGPLVREGQRPFGVPQGDRSLAACVLQSFTGCIVSHRLSLNDGSTLGLKFESFVMM